MIRLRSACWRQSLGCGLLLLWFANADDGWAKPRNIVLIAGKKSHQPGEHEYEKTVRLLKALLDRAPNLKNIRTEIHFNGWPARPETLDDADTIVTISDGQDGNLYSPVPFMTGDRMQIMERQMKRGCGFMTFHFSTFAPDALAPQILEWGGGYFDWQGDDGKRNWFSAIKTIEDDLKFGSPNHPVTKGLAPFRFRDEFYYRIRFRENDERLKPILLAPALGGTTLEQTVAWAVERRDGGRGFATTTGHYFANWQNDSYRKLILNAIVWTAKAKVPKEGVKSEYMDEAAVEAALRK